MKKKFCNCYHFPTKYYTQRNYTITHTWAILIYIIEGMAIYQISGKKGNKPILSFCGKPVADMALSQKGKRPFIIVRWLNLRIEHFEFIHLGGQYAAAVKVVH